MKKYKALEKEDYPYVVGRKPNRKGETVVLQMRRYSAKNLSILSKRYPEKNHWRPKQRSDCSTFGRPCPYVLCKYHLYLDVKPGGSIMFNFPEKEVWEMEESCVLDIVDKEQGMTLNAVGLTLNITRERVRQIQEDGLKKTVFQIKYNIKVKETFDGFLET